MLGFLRRHQKYFFAVITLVIVISFSFFGTYSTLQQQEVSDPVVFTAIDGSKITRSTLEQMVHFLGTDVEDLQWMGGIWGPNFLNNGVIKNDIIQTGLASIIVAPYLADLSGDLDSRLEKEQKYKTYEHPDGKFLTATNTWNYVVPQMNLYLEQLKGLKSSSTPEAFDLRVKLFQTQRQFPPYALKQAIRYQEKQFNWIKPDQELAYGDLSLFGYHTVDDWFGPKFTRLVAEFIINASLAANEKGYTVSKEEAYADLIRNVEIAYKANKNNPRLGVGNSADYFKEQLRRMGMDLTDAISIWQKVLLFRNYFQDVGSSVFVDPFTISQFQTFVKESAEGVLYQLPEELFLGDFSALQKFEIYLAGISKPSGLSIPETFYAAKDITPELLQKTYVLEVTPVDKNALQAKISLKETWNWEVQDKNWEKLKKEFPDLGVKKGGNTEERMAALDSLDNKTRSRVDGYARTEIVNENPQWMEKVLKESTPEKRNIAIRSKGGKDPLVGIKDRAAFLNLLETWPASKEKLALYSEDGRYFYKIEVIEKGNLEVLTFKEASQDGTLDTLLTKKLESAYPSIREKHPEEFKDGKGGWKSFATVQNKVAEYYFEAILAAIQKEIGGEKMVPDYAASYRLKPFVSAIKDKLIKNRDKESLYVRLDQNEPNYKDQWKLVKKPYTIDRSSNESEIDRDEVLALKPQSFSNVATKRNGENAFFQFLQKGNGVDNKWLYENIYQTQHLLGFEAQKVLAEELMKEFKDRGAISLEYLKK